MRMDWTTPYVPMPMSLTVRAYREKDISSYNIEEAGGERAVKIVLIKDEMG